MTTSRRASRSGTSFTDTRATEGSHTYYVTARAGGAESGHSNTVRVTYAPRLPAPTGLSAPPTYTSGVVLTWYPVSGAAAYEVYRDGALLPQVKETSFTDSAVTSGTHSYTVATVNRIGAVGPTSGAVSVDYVPPSIP